MNNSLTAKIRDTAYKLRQQDRNFEEHRKHNIKTLWTKIIPLILLAPLGLTLLSHLFSPANLAQHHILIVSIYAIVATISISKFCHFAYRDIKYKMSHSKIKQSLKEELEILREKEMQGQLKEIEFSL